MPEKINAAEQMKAAAKALHNEEHRQKILTLASTRRHILISYPYDLTNEELLDFMGYLTHQFRAELPASTGIIAARRT